MSAKVKVAGQTITQLEGKLAECKKAVEGLFGIVTKLNAKNKAMEVQLGEYQGVKKGFSDNKPKHFRTDDLQRILTAAGISKAESIRLLEGLNYNISYLTNKGDMRYKTMRMIRRLHVMTDTDSKKPIITSLIVDEITKNVVVCDLANECVKCFDSDGSLKWKYTTPSRPCSIAMLRRTIVVTLEYNDTMLILSLDGDTVTEVKHGVNYIFPAIAVYEDHVLICDDGEIYVYRMSGEYQLDKIRVISTMLLWSGYIHVTRDKILVTDWDTDTLQAYNWQGEHQFTYGNGETSQAAELYMPHAVCTDSSNNILIADSNNHRIVLLSPRGQFIRHLLTEEDGISKSIGLAVTEPGLLYVSGYDNTVDVYGE